MTSPDHASLARTRKVLRLAAIIPHGQDAAECESIADAVATASPEWRLAVAHEAGVNPPSDVTWGLLVQVLRERAARVNPFARVRTTEARR